jgi:hypothetical protein
MPRVKRGLQRSAVAGGRHHRHVPVASVDVVWRAYGVGAHAGSAAGYRVAHQPATAGAARFHSYGEQLPRAAPFQPRQTPAQERRLTEARQLIGRVIVAPSKSYATLPTPPRQRYPPTGSRPAEISRAHNGSSLYSRVTVPSLARSSKRGSQSSSELSYKYRRSTSAATWAQLASDAT